MASASLSPRRRRRNPIVVEDRIAGWVFIAPAMILFMTFLFGPVLFAFFISLHHWELVRPERTFVGLDNYADILSDDDFWIAFRNTTWYAAGVVPAQTIIGLVLAVLANRKIRGRTFFRTAFYFPSISSSVVISIIFLWMYSRRGLVNYLLESLGLPIPQPVWLANPRGVLEIALNNLGFDNVSDWLAGPSFALLAIMMLNIWTTAGTMMVIYLAGLQDVPTDVYEAASLDGASRWRMFRDITVPLLKPVTAFVVTVGLIGTFQVFDQIWVMSEGGPQKTTTTLAYLIYLEAFRFGEGFGYGSAIAIILFCIVLALYFVQKRVTGETAQQ
ncbi:MAG: carbohydrate ABC transporter permease [Thermomicrobiales bacterium]